MTEVKPCCHFDEQEIRRVLPHAPPFLQVERIVAMEPGRRGVGLKNITDNDCFLLRYGGEKAIMPAGLIIEMMAQVGGFVMLRDSPGKILFLTGVRRARFRRKVVPGDTLVVEVTLTRIRKVVGHARGIATVNGQVVCEANLSFAFSP